MKVLLLLAALVACSYACKDKSKYCRSYIHICKLSTDIQKLCPKTCKACNTTVFTTAKPKWVTPKPTARPPRTPRPPPRTWPPRTRIPWTPKPKTTPEPWTGTHEPWTQPPGICGQKMISTSRVIGGKDAKPGEWPWQILLQKYGRPNCGGSIINKRWVVTAAHCVSRSSARYTSFVTGETDRTKQEGYEDIYNAEKVIVHPRYGARGVPRLDADIALIKADRDIQFNRYVQPVCLPNESIPPGTPNCYISGFGKIRHPGSMHTKLQYARMPPVNNTVCNTKNQKVIRTLTVTPGMICAGEGGINPISGCHGDSGGPYVCEVNGKWELQGAVSWGSPRCKSTETYTVFARVDHYKRWITDEMAKHGI